MAASLGAGRSRDLRLSINLLPEDLARAGYDDWLLDEIAAAGRRPGAGDGRDHRKRLLDRPRPASRSGWRGCAQPGSQIAVDDFGTGYASLAYLTILPLDTLKIDRGLIADIVGGSRDRIVVKAMIRMARELGLKVVVEGVETHRAAGAARRMGLRPLPGLPRRRRARRGRAGAVRRRSHAPKPLRPVRSGSFSASLAATTRARPRDSCSAPLSRASAGRPVAADDQLAVGPQLGRALQPLDIGQQPGEVGEAAVDEGHHRALGADVELGDARRAAVDLGLDDLSAGCWFPAAACRSGRSSRRRIRRRPGGPRARPGGGTGPCAGRGRGHRLRG